MRKVKPRLIWESWKGGEEEIMVKKIAALAGGAALLLGAALPTLAGFNGYLFSKDVALVQNTAYSVADTGGNTQNVTATKGGDVDDAGGSRYIDTGDASSYAGALVVANVHKGCGCESGFYHKDFAKVENIADSYALTGYNAQDVKATKGGDVDDADGSRTIYTGGATSIARAWTLTNIHWGN